MSRPPPDPVARAIGLLARREHSRRELARKLVAKGVEPEAAREAVETLSGKGWQDDARFAQTLVRTRAAGGYGPLRVRMELEQHGVDTADIDAAMAEEVASWRAVAEDLVGRRFAVADLEDPVRRRKAVELLLRRGFGRDDAYAAVEALCDPDA
ncbi:regulatory protein RecX [Coralloluteibacterium thermophilus]|uniref:Regulatory protein RecX n=1 Tax=Coralloluteibacterium thermophilum TaxID=2707049 RepID=A0ABV9NF82_9GAMM